MLEDTSKYESQSEDNTCIYKSEIPDIMECSVASNKLLKTNIDS